MTTCKASSAALALLLLATGLAACGSDDSNPAPGSAPAPTPASAPAPGAGPSPSTGNVGDVVALTASKRVISFDRATPGTIRTSVPLAGLMTGESLLGIDRRPADGLLYALGSTGRLYTLDAASGALTFKVALVAAAGDDNPFTAVPAIAGFGIDFNPAADRLRVVGVDGTDLRINVDTGATFTDRAINGGPAGTAISASAYTNSFAGAAATRLFAIDPQAGTLFIQNPPNEGTLTTPVPLGVKATSANGFDIDARTNIGYAALTNGTLSTLYSVNVDATSNPLAPIGAIGGGEAVTGIALAQPAKPTAVGLTANRQLVIFDPTNPNTLTATTSITGLGAGENVLGIDIRPADGKLYALTSGAKVYAIDVATGAATIASTMNASPTDTTAPFAGLAGSFYSVDFNPAADRMRVISDTGQNLRINVQTGETFTDNAINGAGPQATVVGAAYSRSFAGTTTTTLYDLDATGDRLFQQQPPNDGSLVTPLPLGIDLARQTAFDIAGGDSGLALTAVTAIPSGPSALFSVSLTTGAATPYPSSGAGSPGASLVGGASGPTLIDLAIRF